MTTPATPKVRGLFEAHLPVARLGDSIRFYRDVVGLAPAYEVPERGAAFLWAGGPGAGMLGLWSLGTMPMGMRLHVAFTAELAELRRAPAALAAVGVTPLSFFGEVAAEPSVIGWMPAAAVYFRDPDGHMLEYLAILDEPARPELGIMSWSDWAKRPPRSAT
jgi:lactoylglutathione lyase